MGAIEIKSLTKKFNNFIAVDNLNFEINEGELFGFLGPNGAGKTTTIYMLATILQPTSGTATINGFDLLKEPEKIRESIGIVFQDQTVDINLSAYDNLKVHAMLYGVESEKIEKRIDEVLNLVELKEKKHELVKRFSGGMKRRLEIARGLVHTPKILFLDEPTLGLDPQTRRHIWDYIEELKKHGVTILLTTHYMEEADALCDRVAIIDRGKLIALDKPSELKSKVGGNLIEIKSNKIDRLMELLNKNKIKNVKISEDKCCVRMKDGSAIIPKIVKIAGEENIEIDGIEFHPPSLEDVFIHYTGKVLRDEAPDQEHMRRHAHAH